MTISGVSSVGQIQPSGKPIAVSQTIQGEGVDFVSLSPEAQIAHDHAYGVEAAHNTSDLREDFVADLRKRMDEPTYLNETVLNGIAAGIINNSEI
ncbi:flagellar biosynthesis anti-sigma factor FlgM [Breznakiellaceae bacterium SP9]